MQTANNLFNKLCSYKNLLRAFNEAKKSKSGMKYVIDFNKDLKNNLLKLQKELLDCTYLPKKLTTFIIRDPKLRTISKSIFKDRIVHHALVQVLEPIFDPTFIYDSYANRIGKGTVKALERCDFFIKQVTRNGSRISSPVGGGGRKEKSIIIFLMLKDTHLKQILGNILIM